MFKFSMKSFYIEALTLFYLAVPFLLFLLFWPKPFYAFILVLFFIFCLALTLKNLWVQKKVITFPFNLRSIGLILVTLLLATIWCYSSGIGGFFFQNGDYLKHNAIFHDLVESEWPVAFKSSLKGVDIPLVYYFGYYIVPAFIAKMSNMVVGEWSWFFFGLLGVLLGIYWFVVSIGSFSWFGLLWIFLFGGLDFLGFTITNHHLPRDLISHLEWWSGLWQYSSNSTLLYWTPQHFISGWILTGVIFNKIYQEKNLYSILFFSILTLFWSPFVSLGLFPLIALGILFRAGIFSLKKLLTIPNIISIFIFFPLLLLFFSSSFYTQNITYYGNQLDILFPRYLLFLLLELSLCLLYLPKLINLFKKRTPNLAFLIALLILIFLPLIRFGEYNDLVMRGSIPSFFILQVFVLYYWQKDKFTFGWQGFRKLVTVILFLGVIPTAFIEINRSVKIGGVASYEYSTILNLRERSSISILAQYLGRGDSFFFSNIAKESSPTIQISSRVEEELYKLKSMEH